MHVINTCWEGLNTCSTPFFLCTGGGSDSLIASYLDISIFRGIYPFAIGYIHGYIFFPRIYLWIYEISAIYPDGYRVNNSGFCELLEKMAWIYTWIYTIFLGYIQYFWYISMDISITRIYPWIYPWRIHPSCQYPWIYPTWQYPWIYPSCQYPTYIHGYMHYIQIYPLWIYLFVDISEKIYLFLDIVKIDIVGYIQNGCIQQRYIQYGYIHKRYIQYGCIQKAYIQYAYIQKRFIACGYIHKKYISNMDIYNNVWTFTLQVFCDLFSNFTPKNLNLWFIWAVELRIVL